MEQPFWNKHYAAFQLQDPSDFSQACIRKRLRKDDVLIELGCGNGRDGLALSEHVAHYIGIDACGVAIENFSKAAQKSPTPLKLLKSDFTALDFNEFAPASGRLVIYSRFSLHSLTYAEQERLLENVAKIRKTPWAFLIEARTIHDTLYGVGKNVGLHEYETDHYRRFIDPSAFLKQIASQFKVPYFEVSNGFAAFKNEDPIVLRAAIEPQS